MTFEALEKLARVDPDVLLAVLRSAGHDVRVASSPGGAMKERCDKCYWWRPWNHEHDARGDCRRHAPVVVSEGESAVSDGWPAVQHDDGCGDWKAEPSHLEAKKAPIEPQTIDLLR